MHNKIFSKCNRYQQFDMHSYSIAFAKFEIMLHLTCRVMNGEMMAIVAVAVFIIHWALGVYSMLVSNFNL